MEEKLVEDFFASTGTLYEYVAMHEETLNIFF
jgi:hypothetical protein